MFDCDFAPFEKISTMEKAIEAVIPNNYKDRWYLYISPPVEKLSKKKFAGKNFEELGLLPRAIVYIGVD